jgi:hypothetical protein
MATLRPESQAMPASLYYLCFAIVAPDRLRTSDRSSSASTFDLRALQNVAAYPDHCEVALAAVEGSLHDPSVVMA